MIFMKAPNALVIILLLSLTTLIAGCAWENLPDEGYQKPFSVRLTLEVQGSIDRNLFYFIVFNLSGQSSQRPEPEFEGEDRGLYWDAYYMYGDPPLGTGLDFYRQIGGVTKAGFPKLDLRPMSSNNMFEFVSTSIPAPGIPPSGNKIRLELDFGAPLNELFENTPNSLSMNMIVASLPYDRDNNPDDPYDAIIYDSFNYQNLGAVTINLSGNKTDFNEQEFKAEQDENIGETPPPNANITSWRLEII